MVVAKARLAGLILFAVVCAVICLGEFEYLFGTGAEDSWLIGALSSAFVWVGYGLIAKDVLSQ